MHPNYLRRTLSLFLPLLLSLALGQSSSAQGPLSPSAPPGSTMKTLDQVEARIPISAAHTPGDNDADVILGKAGSYYLTGNLDVTKSEGIRVTAADVTIDLNGYQIRRVAGGTAGAAGIKVIVGADRCTVTNGSIAFLQYAVVAAADDSFAQAEAGSILHVRAFGCVFGLSVGGRWHIASCTVQGNSGVGINAPDGATVESCNALRNGTGIIASGVVSHCTASGNSADGFDLSSGSIDHCSATDNTLDGIHSTGRASITDCLVAGNQQHGISLGDGGSVNNCVVRSNKNDGIRTSGNAFVANNSCSSNGVGAAFGAGIHAQGSANRIEGNNTSNNDTGILVDGGGNLIIRNSSRGGSKAYDIAAGNSEGQEINVFNASTTTVITNSNPWANFLY